MSSTPNPTAVDPTDVLVARADERLAQVYEQLAQADEQIARVTEQISRLDQDTLDHPSVDLGRLPLRDRPLLRGLLGLLLATCIFVAAFILQSSYGDAAKPIIARWVPQIILASSSSLQKLESPAQPKQSTVQLVAAEPAPPQQAPQGQTVPHEVSPAAAPVSPEPSQLLQTITHDLANLAQEIEQLKATQQQVAGDNAKAIAEIKAGQDQAARDNARAAEVLRASQEQLKQLIAKASEQSLRPKVSAPEPKPIATATRKPLTTPAPRHRANP